LQILARIDLNGGQGWNRTTDTWTDRITFEAFIMISLTKKLAATFILLALAGTAAAALVNFRFIANTGWTTKEAVRKINE
jgi:hypothetical protein